MNSTTRFVTALAAGVLASSAAFADSTPYGSAEVVETSYSAEFVRSDLATPLGAKAAYSRLKSLARRACTDGSSFRSASMFEEQKCAAKALDAAVKDLASPAVAQLHAASIG
jgi:UrcA family protein